MDVDPRNEDETEVPPADATSATASADSRRDEPLQLIDFIRVDNDGNTKINLIDQTINTIIDKAGTRPLCVICICGPSREGKSFLLGHMIRCLEAMELEEPDWMDWANKTKALAGFKFRNGTKPETQGIWIWSRPFIVKNDEDKEIAVLLVDTQGTCDEFTTSKDMSAIVGLSLLMSSVMIFNCSKILQEDILLSLNTYTSYGQLALENIEGTPFQKLIFLIRDWNNPGEYPYGSKGGKTFLTEKLKIKPDHPQEAKQVRQTINSCFNDLDCFLMPNIGEKAILPGFTGSIGELSTAFARKMEEFINNLISSDTLTVKQVVGNEVTAVELKTYLENYLKIFNSGEIPSATVMWEATSDVHNSNILRRIRQKFIEIVKKRQRGNSYLSEEDLDKAGKAGEKQAMEMFKKARKFGSAEKIAEYKEQLEMDIEKEFAGMKKQNEEKRKKYVAGVINDAATKYRALLDELVSLDDDDTTFYEDTELKRLTERAKREVIDELQEKVENENEEKVAVIIQSMEDIIESPYHVVMNKNTAQRLNAEKKMHTIVEQLTGEFKQELEYFISENKFSSFDELKTTQEKAKASTLESFKKTKKPGKKDFHKEFEAKLTKSLDDSYSNMENEHKLYLQECQMKAGDYIKEKCNEYETELREKLGMGNELVEGIHDSVVKSIMGVLSQEENPYPDGHPMHEQLCDNLTNQFQLIFEKVKEEMIFSNQRIQESYSKAVNASVSLYNKEMDDIVTSGDFLSEEDLSFEDERIQKEAVAYFEDIEFEDVPDNALDFKLELQEKLRSEYEAARTKNNLNRQLAHSKAKNCVNDCNAKYEASMKLDSIRTNEQLEKLHQQALQDAVELFQEKCPAKEDPKFIETYKEDLVEKINEAFEELKEIFETKREGEEMATKAVLVDCRKYYHDEMQKHCKNTPFIRPDRLDAYHKQAQNAVITKCGNKSPLSAFQKLDLETEMDNLYLKIKDENDMKLNSAANVPPAIGIDLGTTYCCVAVYYGGKVVIIPNQEQANSLTTASYVTYNSDGTTTFGNIAKQNAYKNPENTIYDAKRIIGRKISDPELIKDMTFWPFVVEEDDGVPKIRVNGTLYYPEQISGELLKAFVVMAEKHLGLNAGTIKKAVITVPAYFNDGQRQATKDAGLLAGLEVLTILNEPTAAAIAYSLERIDNSPRKVLIFDLGGGTFDVAVLDVTPGNIQVLGVEGDTHLGGEDFDQKLMEYCTLRFMAEKGVNMMDGKDSTVRAERATARRRLRRLQTECEKAKKTLTSGRSATVTIDAMYDTLDLVVDVTREKFEELNKEDFQKTIDIVDRALKAVGVEKEEIEDVVLVGGSTRIPKVQELLTQYFGGKALNFSINPDEAVGYGAAVKAALMNGEQAKGDINFEQIADVTPMSLGIETYTKEFSVIIPKNTQVPQKLIQDYGTPKDNQTRAQIRIFQGEDPIAAKNDLLGEFLLDGIPPAKAGKERIDVSMELDTMGILHVEAVCRSTKGSNKITVTENKQRMSTETKNRLIAEGSAAA